MFSELLPDIAARGTCSRTAGPKLSVIEARVAQPRRQRRHEKISRSRGCLVFRRDYREIDFISGVYAASVGRRSLRRGAVATLSSARSSDQ